MKLELFKPDDFKDIFRKIMKDGYLSKGAGDMWEPESRPDDLPDLANRILNEYLESLPVVYGDTVDGFFSTVPRGKDDAHTARLICIEEINRDPCKHDPDTIKLNYLIREAVIQIKCRYCGVALKANWVEA